MKAPRIAAALLVLATLPSLAEAGPAAAAGLYWGQWRGPLATGEAPTGDPPTVWSETENIRFKVTIPGHGHASPIVWGDRVFLLSAMDGGAPPPASGSRRRREPAGPVRFVVLALDRATGATVWQRTAREELPHESGIHPDATWASASAATDGEVLVASFGSRGLYASDLDGQLLWSADLGDMTTRHSFGEGSSPTLAGGTVVVNWDHEDDSFVVALDKRTGTELWRRERAERTSWSTPLVVEHGGRRQVVISATDKIRGYDLESGETLWEIAGMTVNVVPSPLHHEGVVYATSGFRASALKAIRLGEAAADPAATELWSYDRDTPYVPSPLLYDGQLYFLKVNSGILSSLDAATGEVVFGPERLPGIDGIYASPVAAAGRIYLVGRGGTTVVARHGTELEILAENVLDERFDASPAIAAGELYLRGHQHLYCIAAPADTPAPGSE